MAATGMARPAIATVSRRGWRLVLVLFVVAGLATGLTAGAVALSIKEKGASHYPQAGTAADVSTVGFIVGGVGAATGALYWWLSLRESAPSARQPSASGSAAIGSTAAVHEVRVRPWVGPGCGGLLGTF